MPQYRVTNNSKRGSRVFYDKAGASVTLGPGQTSKPLELSDAAARRLGVGLSVTAAGSPPPSAAAGPAAPPADPPGSGGAATRAAARDLLGRAEGMSAVDLRRAVEERGLLSPIPPTKRGVIEALEELASPKGG